MFARGQWEWELQNWFLLLQLLSLLLLTVQSLLPQCKEEVEGGAARCRQQIKDWVAVGKQTKNKWGSRNFMAAYRALTRSELVQAEEEVNFLVSLGLLLYIVLVLWQHGDLRVHVIAARDLPDTDNTFFNISRGDWTDPFVTVFLDQVNPVFIL